MAFDWNSEDDTYTCCECGSCNVSTSVIKSMADIETEIFNDEGDVIDYVTTSRNGTLIKCNDCDNRDAEDY